MTGAGRVAYNKMVKAIATGELSINEGVAAVIKACDELEAYYELQYEMQGQQVPMSEIQKTRDIVHKAYNAIHNLWFR
jgi:hypothetical protein